jgi:hypothetical protein
MSAASRADFLAGFSNVSSGDNLQCSLDIINDMSAVLQRSKACQQLVKHVSS